MHCRRLVPARPPFSHGPRFNRDHPYQALPQWPAAWVHPPEPPAPPYVGLFRLRIELTEKVVWRFALTADERFEWFVDGELIDRGPDRGDRQHWYYATYELALEPGGHQLDVRVWALGRLAPTAQITFRPGLLVAGEEEAHHYLSTGVAEWNWRQEPAWEFHEKRMVGPEEWRDFRQPPAVWQIASSGLSGNDGFEMYPMEKPLLAPSLLPAQRRDRHDTIESVHLDNGTLRDRWVAKDAIDQSLVLPLEIPQHSRRRMLFDLKKSICGRLQLRVSQGADATIRSLWAEAAYFHGTAPENAGARQRWDTMKGRRDEWRNGFFRGLEDQWIMDGHSHEATTLWWRSGRFVALQIETRETPLRLESIEVEVTGYPFASPDISSGIERWDRLAGICLNTLEACAHETLMDCPHYEQLAYAGDARVQFQCWLALCPDDTALMRHTLRHFWTSTLNPGRWTGSSAPSRGCQTIPTFSLWWVVMAADYLAHTGDRPLVHPMLPVLRAMVERWLEQGDATNGLIRSPAGWNFVDWAYQGGVPPGGMPGGISTPLNWIVVQALRAMEQLETAVEEPLLAKRWRMKKEALVAALVRETWDANRGIFTDSPGDACFSEQTQALALLEELPESHVKSIGDWLAAVDDDSDVVRCQAFFNYYLFEACQRHGWLNEIERRLQPWWALLEAGFTTTPENFGVTRSDTHAWGAYPILLALKKSSMCEAT